MYEIKNRIYQTLTKTQKSALCNFLRQLVKKTPQMTCDEIFNKFVDDENYYFEINNPHFEFLKDYLEDSEFQEQTLFATLRIEILEGAVEKEVFFPVRIP